MTYKGWADGPQETERPAGRRASITGEGVLGTVQVPGPIWKWGRTQAYVTWEELIAVTFWGGPYPLNRTVSLWHLPHHVDGLPQNKGGEVSTPTSSAGSGLAPWWGCRATEDIASSSRLRWVSF